MLFTMVIDTLNCFLRHAVSAGILRRLAARHAASSISLFADDVVIFCHTDAAEIAAVCGLLHVFGDASGLRTNFAKCSVPTIECTPEDAAATGNALECKVANFPITYLGLPPSIRKVPSSALMPLVDKMLKKLTTWKAAFLSRGERLALVRHVLSAMPVHILLAMSLNPTILRRINRVIRDSFLHGHKDQGGCVPGELAACV